MEGLRRGDGEGGDKIEDTVIMRREEA